MSYSTLCIRASPAGKTPALVLTVRDGVDDHPIETDDEFIFVLNLPRYLAGVRADAALTYLAQRIAGPPARCGASSRSGEPGGD